jgi:hypothetical protein
MKAVELVVFSKDTTRLPLGRSRTELTFQINTKI